MRLRCTSGSTTLSQFDHQINLLRLRRWLILDPSPSPRLRATDILQPRVLEVALFGPCDSRSSRGMFRQARRSLAKRGREPAVLGAGSR